MNVAAYCRVSTDKTDQLNSLQMQKQFFSEFTQRNGHTLVQLYADEGISGTKIKNRKEFLRLMHDAKQGLFEMVIVKDISRFARNTVDFLQSIRALKALGIETTFLTANMTALGNSEFVLTIFGALAQEESANTSKRVKFGKRLNAEKGRVPNLAFGYDKVPGDYFCLHINEQEADVVRQIYRWYLEQGYGASKIAGLLNQRGLTTKRGCSWSQNAVCRILTNRLYCGQIVNGKQEVSDFLTGSRIAKDPQDWIVTDRPELAIVTAQQYAQVQSILSQRRSSFKTQKTRHSNVHLFSTLLKCPLCGWSFRRTVRTYQNTYVRWVCSGHNTKGTGCCSNGATVDESALLDALQSYFTAQLTASCFCAKSLQADLYHAYQAQLQQEPCKDLHQKISRLRALRQKYLDLFAGDLVSAQELHTNLQRLRTELEALEQQQAALSRPVPPPGQIQAQIELQFASVPAFVPVDRLCNTQLKTLIECILVQPDGSLDVYFNAFSAAQP